MKKLVFIVNGKYPRSVQAANQIGAFANAEMHMAIRITRHKGHAIDLAAAAVSTGHTHLIAVGGDGTLNEVINGMMMANQTAEEDGMLRQRIGLLPLGTGNDFSRNFCLPTNPAAVLDLIQKDRYREVDIGHIRLKNGKERYFINIADVGIGGRVAEKMEGLPRWMGSFLTYQYAVLKTLFTYRKPMVKIEGNGFTYSGPILAAIMANGVFFGGGLGIAPGAELDNGQMEVVILGDVSILDYIRNLHKVKQSIPLKHPQAFYYKSDYIRIAPLNGDVPIDVDGEFLGHLPLEARILPRRIKMLC